MKFLIDGHRDRVSFRAEQWPEGVCGQLLTPLTRYRRGHCDGSGISRYDHMIETLRDLFNDKNL